MSAADIAKRWKAGLAEWDQDGRRIARLREAADVRVYTPGSQRRNAARDSWATLSRRATRPRKMRKAGSRRLRQRPAWSRGHDRSCSHTAVSRRSYRRSCRRVEAKDPDLAWLVQQIQSPVVRARRRPRPRDVLPGARSSGLALRFNSVLAAPGFDPWSTGEPLEAGSLLFTPDGPAAHRDHLDRAPRRAAANACRLARAERRAQWTRRQTGTAHCVRWSTWTKFRLSSPGGQPAVEAPLLTLLKQARAFGVGIALATQNPVDLDYKALSNIGTWFLGKLQTERDKARVLDGLEGSPADSIGRRSTRRCRRCVAGCS